MRVWRESLGITMQSYPTRQIPQNRHFAQFHSPQTDKMKQFELISSNVSESCKRRVIFATVALGMGVNSPCAERIIHFGVPELWRVFFKKVGELAELEEMGGLLHQLFTSTTMILVQKLKNAIYYDRLL